MGGTARIRIEKAARRLVLALADGGERRFAVGLGRNAAADKAVEGDHATPLGEFYVCAKNPRSRFHLSLCLSYPNAEDAERGLAANLIDAAEYGQILAAVRLGKMPPQKTRLGGEIYIHGSPADGVAARGDWTRGCIALDNEDMEVVYHAAEIGTGVSIVD